MLIYLSIALIIFIAAVIVIITAYNYRKENVTVGDIIIVFVGSLVYPITILYLIGYNYSDNVLINNGEDKK